MGRTGGRKTAAGMRPGGSAQVPHHLGTGKSCCLGAPRWRRRSRGRSRVLPGGGGGVAVQDRHPLHLGSSDSAITTAFRDLEGLARAGSDPLQRRQGIGAVRGGCHPRRGPRLCWPGAGPRPSGEQCGRSSAGAGVMQAVIRQCGASRCARLAVARASQIHCARRDRQGHQQYCHMAGASCHRVVTRDAGARSLHWTVPALQIGAGATTVC